MDMYAGFSGQAYLRRYLVPCIVLFDIAEKQYRRMHDAIDVNLRHSVSRNEMRPNRPIYVRNGIDILNGFTLGIYNLNG
jgi:hypothetical protein